MKSIEERFFEKVNKTDTCWIWTGAVGGSGYGHMYLEGKIVDAHRISFVLSNGPIPDGIYVLHSISCNNKTCVNPEHLRLGTAHDNMIDMHIVKPRGIPANCTMKGKHLSDKTKAILSTLAKGNQRCKGRPMPANLGRDPKTGRLISLKARTIGDPSVTIRRR